MITAIEPTTKTRSDCLVEVLNKKVVTMNTNEYTFYVGMKSGFAAYIDGVLVDNSKVKWSSSNTAVASVDSAGKVTAKKAGTAVITAKTEDGEFVATSTITVNQIPTSVSVTSVTLSETSVFSIKPIFSNLNLSIFFPYNNTTFFIMMLPP